MKKVFALLLVLVMVCSMAACDKGDAKETPKNLQTVEMEVEASGLEELTKVTVGAPQNMTVEKKDWCVVFSDEKQNVSVETYLLCDYDCYDINQEYAKEEYEGYGEYKFGDYKGYYYLSSSGYDLEVFVYLGCVAEIDDVYLSFTISALDETSGDLMELFKLQDVQTILSSAVFYPAQETTEGE